MDVEFREPTPFEIAVDLCVDECAIEFYENDSLPVVVNPWNPFEFSVVYRDGVWYCSGKYQCLEDKDQYVTIDKAYTNETIFSIMEIYGYGKEGERNRDNNPDDNS